MTSGEPVASADEIRARFQAYVDATGVSMAEFVAGWERLCKFLSEAFVSLQPFVDALKDDES